MTKTADRRRIRGEESRQAILEGAIDSIAQRGLGGTTLDTVAEIAGVSRSLVLFHFKTKDRLQVEVLDFLGARFGEGWDAILADPGLSPDKKLVALLHYDVRFVIEQPRYVAVWHAVWGEARANTLYREVSFPRDRQHIDDIRDLLLAIEQPGTGITPDITAVLKGLEAMLFGFWWQAHINLTPDHVCVAMRALKSCLSPSFPEHFPAD